MMYHKALLGGDVARGYHAQGSRTASERLIPYVIRGFIYFRFGCLFVGQFIHSVPVPFGSL